MAQDPTEIPVVITSVEPLIDRPDRARIDLSDGRWFEVEQTHPDRATLRPGLDARCPPVEALVEAHERREIRAKALDLLGRRDHLSSELRRRLEEERADLVEAELEALHEDGWLEDLAVARRRIARWREKGRSIQECRSRLENDGLEPSAIDEAIGGEDGETDVASLKSLIERGSISPANLGTSDLRRMAARWQRRGFETDTIRRVLREYDVPDSVLDSPDDDAFLEDDQ